MIDHEEDPKDFWRQCALQVLGTPGATAELAAKTADKMMNREAERFPETKILGMVSTKDLNAATTKTCQTVLDAFDSSHLTQVEITNIHNIIRRSLSELL